MNVFTGEHLRHMANAALAALEREKTRINGLNVFPVPDGDTGTNMAATLKAAVEGVGTGKLHEQAKALAHSALWGARGNSGTILSQFFQGFYLEVQGLETAGPGALAQALARAAETAYNAVTQPQEGTMLTVGRAAADAAQAAADAGADVEAVLAGGLVAASEALERTPELLPILREAGVVDAGGEGLVVCATAALEAFRAGEAYVADPIIPHVATDLDARHDADPRTIDPHARFAIHEADITFKYCTEFLIGGSHIDLDELRSRLAPLGDSLMVVGSPELVKVHVHTDHPGKALEEGCEWGDLMDVSVGNMQKQNAESLRNEAPRKGVGVVAVGWGAGFSEIMSSYGVSEIIPATSSLKPSAGQLRDAIERAPSQRIILLPGHKDVALAARQGADMSSKEVAILPAYTAPAAILALLQFDPTAEFKENVRAMTAGLNGIRVAQVTQAARDAAVQGVAVSRGDFIALIDDTLVASTSDLFESVRAAVAVLKPEADSLITLYFGERVQSEVAEEHLRLLQEEFANCEFEVYEGGQSTYDYWIAIE